MNAAEKLRQIAAAPAWKWWLGAGLVFFVVLVVRVFWDSRVELHAANEALAAGDRDAAVFHYRAAAKWYAPGNSANRDALMALLELGQTAEDGRDWDGALYAYDAVRAGTLGVRWLVTPHEDLLERANARLPDVMLQSRLAASDAPPVPPSEVEQLRGQFAAALQRDHTPHRGLSLVISVGFVGWLLSMWFGIRKSFDGEGRLVRGQALRWGGITASAMVVWLGGLWALIYV
jgi:hypothetical protein